MRLTSCVISDNIFLVKQFCRPVLLDLADDWRDVYVVVFAGHLEILFEPDAPLGQLGGTVAADDDDILLGLVVFLYHQMDVVSGRCRR